ncbi:MAG: hypothetical protein M3P44_15995 [Actinomycetota bacterium]|nr:hypothetical protein [Actinomycetota bacterium]
MGVIAEFLQGQRIYFQHVAGVVVPGLDVPVHNADRLTPGPIDDWDDDELELLIEEGRRQSDRQQDQLEQIRGRAQWLFTVGVAVLAALGGALGAGQHRAVGLALWSIVALTLLAYGIGGATAILVAKADFKMIHTAVLSRLKRPIDRELASAYARMMSMGEDTVATRLTVFRQAVVFCLMGGYLGFIAQLAASL